MDDASPSREHGPRQNALDALWQTLRRPWRRVLSLGMITELSLRASFEVKTISPKRIRNHVQLGRVPDCDRCDDICCVGTENVVSLRIVDIARLIDIGRTDLIEKRKPNFPKSMLRQRPGLYELVGSELWRTLPVLRQVGPQKICAALTQDLRCSLYPDWPTSCERFPYSFIAAERIVKWGTRCPSWKVDRAEHAERTRELFDASIQAYNERVKDAILLAHARKQLNTMGIGEFLTEPGEDPFEDPPPLPIID